MEAVSYRQDLSGVCRINLTDKDTGRAERRCLRVKCLTVAPQFRPHVQSTLLVFPSKCKWSLIGGGVGTICVCTIVMVLFCSGTVRNVLFAHTSMNFKKVSDGRGREGNSEH